MGSSNNSGINTSESFNGRKLRPLIPRPSSSTTATSSTATSSSCSTRTHGSDFFAFHDHLGGLEQGKRQLTAHPVSCRWNPTPEQLRVLEDLYQRGTHTPTAEQIRHITAQLRRFGKIEGKNVFYWFQNHKARERQKRRRQTQEATNMGDCNLEILDRKDSGSSRTGFQMEACKNWLPPTTCSILAEESASMSRRRDEWLHHNPELQHHSSQEMLASWHMSNLSTSPYFINANNISNGNPSIAAAVTTVLSKQKFIINENIDVGDDSDECRRLQTLDLFPVCSNGSILDEKSQAAGTPTAMNVAPYHFFHFL